jgi:GMP synthase (glutamine-hydrolysing)
MKVLAVAHVAFEGVESFGEVLKARGAEITEIVSCLEDISAVDAKEYDLAVVCGGSMGVYQADIFPYLNNEIKFIEQRLKNNLPIIGICLGSQLMAKALGADVYPGKQGQEIGWYPLTLSEEGKNSPVRHLAGDKTQMLHWHGDTYDFPEGATLLASSDKYKIQAYEWRDCALGLQCHPEVTAESLECWLASGGFSSVEKHSGMTVPEFRAASQKNAKVLQAQSALFLNEWLDKVFAKRQAA